MSTGVIDLSAPTGHYEVAVFHHAGDVYEVCEDRGHGPCAIYESTGRDKALGVAEYCESMGRIYRKDNGAFVTNVGEPFAGSVWHWDCGCTKGTQR